MNLSPVKAIPLALVLALLVIFVIDPLDPSTFSTPFCLGMIMMWFSLRQKPWVVLTVTICYCLLDFYATDLFLGNVHIPLQHPYFWFFQRFGLFFVLSVMAVYLSYHREESERNLTHIKTVLGKLPAPVIISNAAGYLTYVNESMTTLFGKPPSDLVGQRYVDLLMNDTEEGKAMRYYIELFGDSRDSAHDVQLKLPVPPHSVPGCAICMGQGALRSMVTVLQFNKVVNSRQEISPAGKSQTVHAGVTER